MNYSRKEVYRLAYLWEKKCAQEAYGWTDEQLDTYWNNPRANDYEHRKADTLSLVRFILENQKVQ